MQRAKRRGQTVFAIEPARTLMVHFVTVDRGCISLVRVWRLKYKGYAVTDIENSCRKDIAALRSVTVTEDIFRELQVRGPDRHWYRYLVLPDSLELMEENEDMNEDDRQEKGGQAPPSSS